MPIEPPREHPSTYYVQDRDNVEEMIRLDIQDKSTTAGMGGVWPELADPTSLRRVLDVGCGTGCWLMEVARTYPTVQKLIGVDISGKMLSYARAKAEEQQLDKRVQFKSMDALRILDFPDACFDLVNQRFAVSWLRTWEWTKLLIEYQRVARPGSIIRITEAEIQMASNSAALTKINNINLETCYNSGRLFTKASDGTTRELARLMTQHGIQDVQTRVYPVTYRAGTVEGQHFYENMRRAFRLALPFFQKWTRVPSDYQEIYEQALKDMQEPDFFATWPLLTAWGTRSDEDPPLMRGLA